MLKNGACCYYYSGGHPGWRLKRASTSYFKTFAVGAVTMSAGRSFTYSLPFGWMQTCLDSSFFSFRECPRSLEVSAIWKKSRHWMPSRDPWKGLYTSIMYMCSFLVRKKHLFELSHVWPWRWACWGTQYVVFMGPVFHNTSKTCLKRVGHCGPEWVEKEMCRFAEDMT